MRRASPALLRRLLDLDERTHVAIAGADLPPVLERVLPRLGRAANHGALWAAVAVVVAAVGGRRGRRGALRGTLALWFSSGVVNGPLKQLARRERPRTGIVPELRAIVHPTSTSFPSGHSASAAAFATGLALEAPLLGAPVAVLAGAVALSRTYTGVHWPGDVLAGVAVGAAVGAMTTRLWPLAEDDPPLAERRWLHGDEHVGARGDGLVLVVNPRSGPRFGGVDLDDLRSRFPDADVRPLAPDDDPATALADAAEHAATLGVSGGDGTVATAAHTALAHDVPLLVVPGGTLNHFARDMGVDSLADAAAAAQHGQVALVDVGTLHDPDGGQPDRTFVNTASVGAYVEFVREREWLEARAGTWLAALVALARVLRRDAPVDVELDGVRERVWMVFVGNCAYAPTGFAPSYRPRMDDGLLDVRLARAGTPLARTRIVLATLLGRLSRERAYVARTCRELHVASCDGHVLPTSCDGEVVPGSASVVFAKQRRALRVLVPPTPAQ